MHILVTKETVEVRAGTGDIVYSQTLANTMKRIENIDSLIMHYLETKCLWMETLHDVRTIEIDNKETRENRCFREIEEADKQIAIHRLLAMHKHSIIATSLTAF